MGAYPTQIAIRPRGPLDAALRVPGSKSLTNRAALVAALARGESVLSGCLESDDTDAMRAALRALGVAIDVRGDVWTVGGRAGVLHAPPQPLDARASGTTARFLAAAALLADGPVVIDGTPRMRERPIADLTDCLRALGGAVEVLGRNGCPPLRTNGGGLDGGRAPIDARRSSQFVSAVLLAAPYARSDVTLDPVGGVVVSAPYVDLTLDVMRAFGARAQWLPGGSLHVAAGHHYAGRAYAVESDASAAAYPFCAAAIAGGRVRVDGVPAGSLQSDFRIVDVLERMGCAVVRGPDSITVERPNGAPLAGVEVDMNELPDAVLALAVVALFAEGPTRIENVANLRIKETDRLAALERELGKLGARAEAGPDWLHVTPGPLRGAAIDTYDDHRMAMAFALAGLRVPGVVIRDPGCVAKTWPDYFAMLERL
ncbi:MAG: 3-phosphoshikimate 1-carboxyvinyltransferase [Proteobacteria bacterium]|nr:MAG: 3-phosphoshikimate 1-carboxyvinyltransferase [Pseudomonadota bacterium]